jgi:LysM domain
LASALPWTFTNDRRSITLDGWSAPFGRPRHGEIVNAGIKVRQQLTYYPGNPTPTVSTFGLEGKPWQLHGRWMDSAIGVLGGAQALVQNFKLLVKDELTVHATWGNILAYDIFVHDLDARFESEAEVVWSLEAHVLVDQQAPVESAPAPVQSPSDLAQQVADALSGADLADLPTVIRALQGQIATDISDLVDSVQAPILTLSDTCFALTDFVSASLTDIGQILSSVALIRAAYLNVRDSTDAMIQQIENQTVATLLDPSGLYAGQDVIRASGSKAQSDADIANLLLLTQALEEQATAAIAGKPTTAYRVRNGDSWESIAALTLGSPSAANAIRDLNGAQQGTRPQAGSTIKIPAQG